MQFIKNRFNDNIYVKFTLLWNALYLIFGEKKISETFLMPQEGSSEWIDCIRLHSCVCQKQNDFNYNASICMKNAFHRQYLQWLMSHDVSRPLKLSPSSWAKIIILTRMPKC